jgi:hypothetical protein
LRGYRLGELAVTVRHLLAASSSQMAEPPDKRTGRDA